MKFLKSHFWYNKRQRNGILFLIIIILILQFIYVFVDFSPISNFQTNSIDIDKYQNQIDSLKKNKKENKKIKIFPFNPNYITDFKGYQLGMNLEEIDRLLAFRAKGKFINSSIEFQNITGVNDSLLNIISPFFKFPEWVKSEQKNKIEKNLYPEKNSTFHIDKQDLNLVTAKELMVINGIGEKLSKRIISYRNMLQGFSLNEQLYEVYYLNKDVADKVLLQFEVIDIPQIQKININQANFKEVLRLPYIDYELTKKIFDYRNEIGGFSSLQELKKIDSFPLEKFDRIALYLMTQKENERMRE
jgi:DNA uptake protein ComE-like DNA-binding protein